jgi:hypothetical protein
MSARALTGAENATQVKDVIKSLEKEVRAKTPA